MDFRRSYGTVLETDARMPLRFYSCVRPNRTQTFEARKKVNIEPAAAGIGYRPELDGLRAVAVALVVAYHLWPVSAPGGFIGVDIFL